MNVSGKLLTEKQRMRIKHPFHIDNEKHADLHELAQRVQRGYSITSDNEDLSRKLDENLQGLYQGTSSSALDKDGR